MISIVENASSILKPLETRAIDKYVEEKHPDVKSATKDRRNKKHDNTNNNEEDGFTTISVKALILFLENFLEERLNSKLNLNSPEKPTQESPWLKHEPSNDMQSKKAANAYAHAAKAARISVNKIKHSSAPELKKIYELIKDLRRLQECGVKYLNVESEKALINGIIDAVKNT